ncbi:MAG: tyrosine--tRNA ligase [Patescibacteria group bacterium]
MKTDQQSIDKFLTRGVQEVFPSREFLDKKLKEGKQLSMYLGIDPTGPTLHLGHLIVLRKMREFQDLGHKIILLIGDFTGLIGDPSDKSAARVRQTRKEVLDNATLYKEQATKVLDFKGKNKAELKYNSKWLSKLTFEDIIELSSHFTVQQMMQRDMFEKRIDESKPIYMHEFMYPLMQGYDCVAMDVDGEIGGNDQMFNMLAGRTLMKELKNKDKFVVTMKLLTDPTGKKMGKSEGNMVTLEDSPDNMFGKVMSWSDDLIMLGFELLTGEDIEKMQQRFDGGQNPRDLKACLAGQIVSSLFGQEQAQKASEHFDSMFKLHETPEEVPEFEMKEETMNIVDVLVESGLASSKGEARRLIDGAGVKIDDVVVQGYDQQVHKGALIQKGKRFFVKVIKKN